MLFRVKPRVSHFGDGEGTREYSQQIPSPAGRAICEQIVLSAGLGNRSERNQAINRRNKDIVKPESRLLFIKPRGKTDGRQQWNTNNAKCNLGGDSNEWVHPTRLRWTEVISCFNELQIFTLKPPIALSQSSSIPIICFYQFVRMAAPSSINWESFLIAAFNGNADYVFMGEICCAFF